MRDLRPAVLVLLLAGCGAAPRPRPPELELPPTIIAAEDLSTWWARFGDPPLAALIGRVLDHNSDLTAAAARVTEAAALVRNADDLLPEIDFRASAGRNQTSDRNAFPRFAGIDRRNPAHSVGIDVAWELDLWGRIRAGSDAALADLLRQRENLRGLRAALAAQAAQSYVRLVALDLRRQLVESTLANRRQALLIQQRRHLAGAGTALEVHQAEAEVEAIEVALPRLRQAQTSAQRALAILAGETPVAIATPLLSRRQDLPLPPPVPPGLPSDLLARRPDVRAAEAALAASSARVAEARGRYFPQIQLTGSVGQESKSLADLFTGPATAWAFAGALVQPLFGLRKIDAQVDAAEARRVQAEANYVHTVQTAFGEAYDALGARTASHDTLTAQDRRIDALLRTERIAAARHEAGAGAFLDLLDARRALLAAQTERIDTAADELTATVDVYRALGGGWEIEVAAPATGSNR